MRRRVRAKNCTIPLLTQPIFCDERSSSALWLRLGGKTRFYFQNWGQIFFIACPISPIPVDLRTPNILVLGGVLCYKDFKRSWQSSRIGRRKKACSLWWALCPVHNNPSWKWDIRLLGIKKPKIHPRARTEDMWSHDRGEKINKLPLPVLEHCYPTRQHC